MNKKFGKILTDLRKAHALTQHDIADVLDINRSTYACYETDKAQPSYAVLLRLSKIYAIPLQQLFEDESSEYESFYQQHQNIMSDVSIGPDSPSDYISGLCYKSTDLHPDEKLMLFRFRLLTNEQKDEIEQEIEKLLNSKG